MKASAKFWPSQTLWHIGWRYFMRNPIQTALMLLGIALGVAVVVAIDLANVSAGRAFDISTQSIAGQSTHQISGGPQGLGEQVYVDLRRAGITRNAAPIITTYVWSEQLGSRYIQMLGIDPFAESGFRTFIGSIDDGSGDRQTGSQSLNAFLTQPGAFLISENLATEHGLVVGSQITLDVGGKKKQASLAGFLSDTGESSNAGLDSILLVDIATAQELTESVGWLSHVDLIIPEGDRETISAIETLLPENARLQPIGTRSQNIREMTRAFQVNLTALSLLALLVGTFLIYNTMTFSVVRRRPLFGILRSIGVMRSEVFGLIFKESLLIGLLGSSLGVFFGILLSTGAVQLVSQTINDLYFVSNVTEFNIPPTTIAKGILLGLIATITASIFPAIEASLTSPRTAIVRSELENKSGRMRYVVAALAVPIMLLGVIGFSLPSESLPLSFIATLITVIGFALLTPLLMSILLKGISPILKSAFGFLGRMAPQTLIQSASRTSIAIAALMIAISVSIGMSLMVGSFRHTVDLWLTQTILGDVYIFSPGVTANEASTTIDEDILEQLQSWPGITKTSLLRTSLIDSPLGSINLGALNLIPYESEELYIQSIGSPEEVWEAVTGGAIIISEPLARRFNISSLHQELEIYTDQGSVKFSIVGIYNDYSSSQGTLLMHLDTYRFHWDDLSVTDVAIWVDDDVDKGDFLEQMNSAFLPIQRLIIRPNDRLKERALEIFDQAFTITYALQFLTIIVAFVGIVSTLLSMQLDRGREIGIMRAIGFSVRQVWALVMLETGLMGILAGLFAMPVGYGLSLILIFIINKRAFGWSLQMQVEPLPFVIALIVAVTAALLAGLYPALRTSNLSPTEVLRGQ